MPTIPHYIDRSFKPKNYNLTKKIVDAMIRKYRMGGRPPLYQKVGKPKRGKPHWRSCRLILKDANYRDLYDSLWCGYKESPDYELVNRNYCAFSRWIINHINEPNARYVYDMVYDSYALHFDTEEDKLQFILKWGYQ
jgi:hypothetical protein